MDVETEAEKNSCVFKNSGIQAQFYQKGKEALLKLAKENNFVADTTEDAAYFTNKTLKQYAAVVFVNTTGDVLNEKQQTAFEKYIQSGKGFVGIHAATDTEYDWPWFCKLVGANFANHPKPQKATLLVANAKHPSTDLLPSVWERFDEWYNFKNRNKDVNVLLTIDEKSYEGGKEGEYHPMSWYHEFDGGRAFYTALGHTEESYKEDLFLKHILGGLKYAMGK
ncbi:MAG: ThuA domain-containing protein [Lacibacter sp.]